LPEVVGEKNDNWSLRAAYEKKRSDYKPTKTLKLRGQRQLKLEGPFANRKRPKLAETLSCGGQDNWSLEDRFPDRRKAVFGQSLEVSQRNDFSSQPEVVGLRQLELGGSPAHARARS
jgi:hypothetical protein